MNITYIKCILKLLINSAFVICSFFLFFESSENKFTDENSVHDKKKLLCLKRVITDTLIGSQSDKLPTLIEPRQAKTCLRKFATG